jgi:ectoine hydroxylase-related dioxygenase (phytanoyl-CoA dioxygenase family)
MLTDAQRHEFETRGFVVVERLLDIADITPFLDEVAAVIDRTANELHAAGELDDRFENAPMDRRLTLLTERSPAVFKALFSGVHRGRELFRLLVHPKILRLVESLIGPEILCHPAYRLRPKLPDIEATKRLTVVPWHQDTAYLSPEGDGNGMVTLWLALSRSTVANGCLEIIPRAHLSGPLPHRNVERRAYLDILPEALPDHAPVPIVVEPGDAVLFSQFAPHGSGSNRTAEIRWSIDMRYHRVGTPSGYPPEAGFLAHSASSPGSAVSSVEEFEALRAAHQPGPAPRRARWPTFAHE